MHLYVVRCSVKEASCVAAVLKTFVGIQCRCNEVWWNSCQIITFWKRLEAVIYKTLIYNNQDDHGTSIHHHISLTSNTFRPSLRIKRIPVHLPSECLVSFSRRWFSEKFCQASRINVIKGLEKSHEQNWQCNYFVVLSSVIVSECVSRLFNMICSRGTVGETPRAVIAVLLVQYLLEVIPF